MEKKKNSKRYIIPASYFRKKGIQPIKVNAPTPTSQNSTATIAQKPTEKKETKPKPQTPKISLKTGKQGSGLSLSSIRRKKEHLIKQMEVEVEEEDLPHEPFSEDEMQEAWSAYIQIVEKKGRHNFASILRIDKPKLIGNAIHVEFPNETNKVEVTRQQYELMQYVRKTLNNYSVTLEISVNEVKAKQYAFTPIDKYNKLKEKNPNIELLRRTFDLDI